MMDEGMFKQRLAEKLSSLRRRDQLTLEEVASASGIAPERLQQYEAGGLFPAVGELMNLSQLFDVGMNHFFTNELSSTKVELVRSNERWKVQPQTDTAAALNYSYEALSYRLTDKAMSPFYIEIPPSAKEVEPLSHEGEEFLFVIAGEVETVIDHKIYHLGPGDAIYFDSRLQHSVKSRGAISARLLACLVNVHRTSVEESPMERAE